MSTDAGVTLADLTTYLHSRLAQRERFVRIGDVLRLIDPRHEAPSLIAAGREADGAIEGIDVVLAEAADEADEHGAAVQERYDRAVGYVEEDR